MILKKSIFIVLALAFVCGCCGVDSPVCHISNGSVSLGFDTSDGRLVSFVNVSSGEDIMDSSSVTGLPWYFLKGKEVVGTDAALKRISRKSSRRIELEWLTADSISVKISVRLGNSGPVSYWTACLEGLKGDEGSTFVYPCLSGIRAKDDEKLVCGEWTGYLWKNLRRTLSPEKPVKRYACKPNMMPLVALYGEGAPDLYAYCDDTEGYNKRAVVEVDSCSSRYSVENYLPIGENSYTVPYKSVVGLYEGDWLDAAKIYRGWGTKQKWCAESRMRNSLTAEWARNTDIWVWNRGNACNVLDEAADLKEYLGGMNVNVLWHWWHNCLYDDTFPEYLPPRDGNEVFKDKVFAAKENGINALLYMNSYQWGNSSDSWTKEGAEQYKASSIDGGDYSKVYNVFTGHALVPMCMATEFWREKYASIAAEAVNNLGASGIYMDQLSNTFSCYNPGHGHSVGGGNYWTDGVHKLTARIRDLTRGKDAVLGGEGHSEQYFSDVDLCLTLQGSWERYKYTPDMEIIPLFEAVYHDYAAAFGSYTSLYYPPYDEKWPSELRPENCEKLLPVEFNAQFRLELAKTFVWGIQPMIANYHSGLRKERPAEMEYLRRMVKTRARSMEYLYEGAMERTPDIECEEMEIDNSKISLYAGRGGDMLTQRKITTPVLYTGTWKSREGNVAVAISNISERGQKVELVFSPEAYGMDGCYSVNVINADGVLSLRDECRGDADIEYDIDALDSIVLEFRKN